MIYFVEGLLEEKNNEYVVLNACGVGYQCFISLKSFVQLPNVGEFVRIFTYYAHKEDSVELYGFLEKEEKDMFLYLISVSGIGVKLATKILSTLDYNDVESAILNKNMKLLTSVSGVGNKSAELIVLNLHDKLKKRSSTKSFTSPTSQKKPNNYEMAIDALIGLGYSEKNCRLVIEQIVSQFPDISLEDTVKKGLIAIANIK